MAARENQGYLIAIILLVLLTVILAILTYFAFSQAGSATSNLNNAEQQLTTANNRLTAFEEQAAILKSYMGLQSFSVGEVNQRMQALQRTGVDDVITETASIQEKFDTEMERYTRATAEGVEKNFTGLLQDFSTALMAKHREIAQLNSSVQEAEDAKRIELEAKDNEIKTVRDQLDQSRKDYNDEVARHTKTKNDLGGQIANAQKENQRLGEVYGRERQSWGKIEEDLKKQVSDLTESVVGMRERLRRYEIKRYDAPDGRIIRVASELGRVYVDLGDADQLRVGQTFAIYDQNLETYERGKEKAKIEIIQITGPHNSYARIVESQNTSPVLTGDFVVTSTWDPGYSVPIALAGSFDLDGDRKSDLERVISIVRQNGGYVIASHDENGRVSGAVSSDTRFLVLGSEPTDPNMLQGWSELIKQADKFEIQQVPVREFLNSMGQRVDSRTVQGTGTISDFQKRQPPTRTNGSAFNNE